MGSAECGDLGFDAYYLCGLRGAFRLWRDFFFPRQAEQREQVRHRADAKANWERRQQQVRERRERIFRTKLRPLIKENYRARMAGELPDEWFWADELASRWGMYVDPDRV